MTISDGTAVLPADAEHPAWQALAEDTGCLVMLTDRDGRIQWMNRAAQDATDPALRGKPLTLHDLLAPAIVTERLPHIRRVAEGGDPVAFEGLCWGTLRRTTYRAAPGGMVLTVCRPLPGPNQPSSADVTLLPARAEDPGRLGGLTPKEREVLALIGLGLTTQQIADQLKRSVKTVEWHRLSLGSKLGANNRVELARIAIRAGLSPMKGSACES